MKMLREIAAVICIATTYSKRFNDPKMRFPFIQIRGLATHNPPAFTTKRATGGRIINSDDEDIVLEAYIANSERTF